MIDTMVSMVRDSIIRFTNDLKFANNEPILSLPDISLDFTDISGFNLTETVVMNRKSELKEPTSEIIYKHFQKLDLLYSDLKNFKNTAHIIYKFYDTIANSDSSINIYHLIKSLVNGVVQESDILSEIDRNSLSLTIESILLSYSKLDKSTIINNKTKIIYNKLLHTGSTLALQEITTDSDANIVRRYKDDIYYKIPSFLNIFDIVQEHNISARPKIFYSDYLTEDTLESNLKDYQIQYSDYLGGSEFTANKEFYSILNQASIKTSESTTSNISILNLLNEIMDDLTYIPKPYRIMDIIDNKLSTSEVPELIKTENSIRDNMTHPLLYTRYSNYSSIKSRVLLDILQNSFLSIDIESFKSVLYLVSSVCVEFIDAYNEILFNKIQEIMDQCESKNQELINPNNSIDDIIKINNEIGKLTKLSKSLANEIIHYNDLPDNVFLIESIFLLMDTNKNTISTTNEIKLIVFLYIVYIYLTEIMEVIEPLNSENLLWQIFPAINDVIEKIQNTCHSIFRAFSSNTKFTLSPLSKKFLE